MGRHRLVARKDRRHSGEVLARAGLAADTDATVLIQGESGTGKELVASLLHAMSRRSDGPFIKMNCAAVTDTLLESTLFGHEKGAFTGAITSRAGRFELAQGGTLFLDEIGDMPLPMQVKLLRVLQEREFERVGGNKTIKVDVRVIAATNASRETLADEARFRQDLLFRLNTVEIVLPPLRQRRDDVPLLAHHFLGRYAEAQEKTIEGFSDEAMEVLMNYEYPGNIRELENIVERAVVLCNEEEILTKHLPQELGQYTLKVYRQSSQQFPTLEENEVEYVSWILKQVDGNKTRAAEILGIDRVSLWRKLKRWGFDENSEETL